MIDSLDEKLHKARNGAENYGKLRGAKEIADDRIKVVYAQLYSELPDHLSTVADKDAWVKRQEPYKQAVLEKENAYADWTAAELFMKVLFAEIAKYQTDRATERQLDKSHR